MGGAVRGKDVGALDMCGACDHAVRMSVMIQIRNVPEELHRTLKSRAALAGKSLSEYLLGEISDIASRPTMEEFRARLATREPVDTSLDIVEIVRAAREER